jgi:hypothetical protein
MKIRNENKNKIMNKNSGKKLRKGIKDKKAN